VDLGANCGNSYYRMKYGWLPGSNETLKYPSPDAWEAYLWECSPQMIDWYLNDLVKNETNVVLVPKAAFTSNGEASFHVTSGQEGYKKEDMPNAACDPASAYNPGGASTLQGSAKRASHTLTYTVETVDFLEWHKGLELREGDVVHMKMDIEGPEKEIIEKFLNDDPTNQICFWHVFWIEYHAEIFEAGTPEYEAHKKFERELPGKFEQKCGRKLWPNIHP
jgi:FkbM family methyltransferase